MWTALYFPHSGIPGFLWKCSDVSLLNCLSVSALTTNIHWGLFNLFFVIVTWQSTWWWFGQLSVRKVLIAPLSSHLLTLKLIGWTITAGLVRNQLDFTSLSSCFILVYSKYCWYSNFNYRCKVNMKAQMNVQKMTFLLVTTEYLGLQLKVRLPGSLIRQLLLIKRDKYIERGRLARCRLMNRYTIMVAVSYLDVRCTYCTITWFHFNAM